MPSPDGFFVDFHIEPKWVVVPIPFTRKELIISRIELIGYIAILQRYEYVWTIVERKTK